MPPFPSRLPLFVVAVIAGTAVPHPIAPDVFTLAYLAARAEVLVTHLFALPFPIPRQFGLAQHFQNLFLLRHIVSPIITVQQRTLERLGVLAVRTCVALESDDPCSDDGREPLVSRSLLVTAVDTAFVEARYRHHDAAKAYCHRADLELTACRFVNQSHGVSNGLIAQVRL